MFLGLKRQKGLILILLPLNDSSSSKVGYRSYLSKYSTYFGQLLTYNIENVPVVRNVSSI